MQTPVCVASLSTPVRKELALKKLYTQERKTKETVSALMSFLGSQHLAWLPPRYKRQAIVPTSVSGITG